MKSPMSLKDLPDYLRNLRANNKTDESLVVDMGRVTAKTNNGKLVAISSLFSVVFVLSLGLLAYDFITPKNITIVLNSNLESKDILKILEENGGEVISVDKAKDSEYEIKLSLRKNKNLFIERLRKNKDIDNIELY
jgi:hypothetical protein